LIAAGQPERGGLPQISPKVAILFAFGAVYYCAGAWAGRSGLRTGRR
jgi:hypothetical protein